MKNEKEFKDIVEGEELLYQIALFCIETKITSVNSIQINFGLGFNKTLEILNELEKRNILSPKQGTKGRVVLVEKESLKRMFNISKATKEERSVLQESEESRVEQEDMNNESFDLEEFFQDLENAFLEEIDLKTKELLIKYDLLNSIFKAIRFPGLINLDMNDYVEILNRGTLCAYCKEVLMKNELPTIHTIANPKDTISIVLDILYPNNIKHSIVESIKDFFKEKYPSADIIYGESYNDDLKEGMIGIFALILTK